jgi:hypothetical protein
VVLVIEEPDLLDDALVHLPGDVALDGGRQLTEYLLLISPQEVLSSHVDHSILELRSELLVNVTVLGELCDDTQLLLDL